LPGSRLNLRKSGKPDFACASDHDIGLDIAKSGFQVDGIDADGQVVGAVN
jgi:hypothetical protein